MELLDLKYVKVQAIPRIESHNEVIIVEKIDSLT
jgi:hypothetical protein